LAHNEYYAKSAKLGQRMLGPLNICETAEATNFISGVQLAVTVGT